MYLDKKYEIISSDDEKKELYQELSRNNVFSLEELDNSLTNLNRDLGREKRIIKTPLDPEMGLLELIEKIPDFLKKFDLWVIDGWDKAFIYGVNNKRLEVPNAKVIIYGTNFYGVEVLRTELTFVDIEEIKYPNETEEQIVKVMDEWNFEMIRRKAKKLALGLYHVFEK